MSLLIKYLITSYSSSSHTAHWLALSKYRCPITTLVILFFLYIYIPIIWYGLAYIFCSLYLGVYFLLSLNCIDSDWLKIMMALSSRNPVLLPVPEEQKLGKMKYRKLSKDPRLTKKLLKTIWCWSNAVYTKNCSKNMAENLVR